MKVRDFIFPAMCLISVGLNLTLIEKLQSANEAIAAKEAQRRDLKQELDSADPECTQQTKQVEQLQEMLNECSVDNQRDATTHVANKLEPQYQLSFEAIRNRVRRQLRLDEPIVISSGELYNCNQLCSSGFVKCAPKCIFTKKKSADVCTFNSQAMSHANGRCLQVGTGLESEVNYPSMAIARQHPKIWTMTYRLDADVPAPYYDPLAFDIVPIGVKPITERKRAAVAVISNCGAKDRKRVIETLRKYIKVDWFGKCEHREWPKGPDGEGLSKIELLRQYAVYLAFENTATMHYSTEKLYGGLAGGAVTVVFGAPNSAAMAPRDSILHIPTIDDAKTVGQKLKKMLEDPEMKDAQRLANWHQSGSWRGDWEQRWGWSREHSGCRLCDALRRRVPVATGADAESFPKLLATVASLQTWELGRKAVVFDMGMNEWQRDQVRGWDDVALVLTYEFHQDPVDKGAVRQHAILFAAEAVGAFLWLEPGTVVEGRLREIDLAISERGFFFVRDGSREVGGEVDRRTLEKLGLPESMSKLPMLAGAVQGYGTLSPTVRHLVLLPVLHCLQREDCRRDSSPAAVLSLVAQTSGMELGAEAHGRLVAAAEEDPPRALALPGVRAAEGTKDKTLKVTVELLKEGVATRDLTLGPMHPRFKPDACVTWLASGSTRKARVVPDVENMDGTVAVRDTSAHASEPSNVRGADLKLCSDADPKEPGSPLPNPLVAGISEATLGAMRVLPGVALKFGASPKYKGRMSMEECAFTCWRDKTCSNFLFNAKNGKCSHAYLNPPAEQPDPDREGEMGVTSGVVHRTRGGAAAAKTEAEWKAMWEKAMYSHHRRGP